jgi:hypothetical protein
MSLAHLCISSPPPMITRALEMHSSFWIEGTSMESRRYQDSQWMASHFLWEPCIFIATRMTEFCP